MSKTLRKHWIELAKIRGWTSDQLPSAIDEEIRNSLFEARQAIGFAMLHLERVVYRTGENLSNSEDQVE